MKTIWPLPMAAEVWKAIDTYLMLAYPGAVPSVIRGRIDALRTAEVDEFYQHPTIERTPAHEPVKYALRLGNSFYPHMKLVIERAPDNVTTLFRADTHDRHVQLQSDSPEMKAFAELLRRNQEIAQRIESAWDERGVMTFKTFLRNDLARRQSKL